MLYSNSSSSIQLFVSNVSYLISQNRGYNQGLCLGILCGGCDLRFNVGLIRQISYHRIELIKLSLNSSTSRAKGISNVGNAAHQGQVMSYCSNCTLRLSFLWY